MTKTKVLRKLENFGAAIAVVAFICTIIAIAMYYVVGIENADNAICISFMAMFIGFVLYIFGHKTE